MDYTPKDYPTASPYFVVNDLPGFVEFLEKIFGGNRTEAIEMADGNVTHAEVRIDRSMLMIGQARDVSPKHTNMMYLYVPDVDKTHATALKYGCTEIMPPGDQFYGDRQSGIVDLEGNTWWLATHFEDVDKEELNKRAKEL